MHKRALIVSVTCLAVVASACTSSTTPSESSSPAPVQSATEPADDGAVAAAGTPADAVQPWLAGAVPGGDGSGPTYPTSWPPSTVVGSGPSTSLSPILIAPDGSRLKGSVSVEVVDLSAGGGFGADGQGAATQLVWEGTAPADRIELPVAQPVLKQGATYAWRGRSGDGPWRGPFSFSVDTVRAQNAPTDELGGVAVNVLSGLPTTSWSSPAFPGATTSLSLGAVYRPGSPVTAGLPAGWTWVLPGSGPIAVTTTGGDDPLSVTLLSSDGSGATFVRTDTGAYVPGLSDGTATGLASGGVLTQLGGTSWRFTAPNGTMTVFADGRAVGEWSGGVPIMALTWDGEGRLTSVADGVSGGRAMQVSYGDGCQAGSWSEGFSAPEGLWCALTYPDGTSTQVGYVSAGDGAQIGLIADPGGLGVGLGWDASARLSGVRQTTATSAAATAGGDWTGVDMTTQLAYDGAGRVASVTVGASAPGGDRVRRTYSYPANASSSGELEATVRQETVSGAGATPVGSTLGSGIVLRVRATAERWQVTERVGVDGLTTSMTYDPETGAMKQGTAPSGRTVSVKSDDVGVTKTTGPFLGSDADAMVSDRTLDAAIDDPTSGAGSRATAWTGLAATAWPQDAAASGGVPQWWDDRVLKDGLAASFGSSPAGNDGPWTAQVSGLWKVADKGDYTIEVSSSSGTTVDLAVDGVRCGDDETRGRCVLPLAAGEHFVTLAIDATKANGSASFDVRAGLDGGTQRIRVADLRPNYQVTTRTRVNDVVGSTEYGWQVIDNPRPWAGGADSVTGPGGRTQRYAYEPLDVASGEFGRLVSATTPGGMVQKTDYYAVGDTATDPCSGASYPQAGLPRRVTRYDGVTITYTYNAAGLVVATATEGEGKTQLSCAAYDAAGRPTTISTTGISGDLVEQTTTTRTWQDGRLTVVDTTELGPGAVVGSGTTTTTTIIDAAGYTAEYVDAAGTRSTFAYQPDGMIAQRVTYAPGAGDPTLTLDFAYGERTGWLTSLTANGEKLASIDYDKYGEPTTIRYPGDVKVDFAYDTAGAPEQMLLSAADRFFDHRISRNSAGRSLSSSLEVNDPAGDVITKHSWAYSYDGAARLKRADLEARGDKAGTGGNRTFEYSYGPGPDGCFAGAGADLDRTGGARDGAAYETCHDDRGRLTWTTDPHVSGGKGKATASYDALGRMTELAPATGDTTLTMEYASGAQARRITDTGAVTELLVANGALLARTLTDAAGTATTTRYGYTGGASPVLVLDESDQVLDIRVPLLGGALAHLTGDTIAVDHTDLYGSALTTTMADGTSRANADATGDSPTGLATRVGPYGEPLDEATQPTGASTGIGTGTRYGFQGVARNPTLDGHHDLTLSARPYHPWLGQFLTFDPVVGASTTGYGYGDGNPLDQSDFSGGESVWDYFGYVGAAIGAIVVGGGLGHVMKSSSKLGYKVAAGVLAAAGVATTGYFAYTAYTDGGSTQDKVYLTIAAAGLLVGAFAGYKLSDPPRQRTVTESSSDPTLNQYEDSPFLSERSSLDNLGKKAQKGLEVVVDENGNVVVGDVYEQLSLNSKADSSFNQGGPKNWTDLRNIRNSEDLLDA